MRKFFKGFMLSLAIMLFGLSFMQAGAVDILDDIKGDINLLKTNEYDDSFIKTFKSKIINFMKSIGSEEEKVDTFWDLSYLLSDAEGRINDINCRKQCMEQRRPIKFIMLSNNICLVSRPIVEGFTPQLQFLFDPKSKQEIFDALSIAEIIGMRF